MIGFYNAFYTVRCYKNSTVYLAILIGKYVA